MANGDFIEVTINVNGQPKPQKTKMQIGCSFENNGAIYRMNKDGKLAIFDKAKQEWGKADAIEMKSYQFDTFQSIAAMDKKEGLSKADIDKAKEVYENKNISFVDTVAKWLKNGYRVISTNLYYAKHKAVAVNVSNGEKSGANMIFKYGEANDATAISDVVNPSPVKTQVVLPKVQVTKKTNTQTKTPKKAGKYELTQEDKNNLKRYSRIKKEWIPYIHKYAKSSGYSETLLMEIINSENYTTKAKYKNENGGLYEVGFGHTTQAKSNTNFTKGFEIGLERAFQWLIQDIKDAEKELKKVGNQYYNYDNLPKSLQHAFLDTAFNRGVGKLNPKSKYYDPNYDKLQLATRKQNYSAAAVYLRQEPEKMKKINRKGLMKRNVYRFLMGIQELPASSKLAAMKLFDRSSYYTTTKNKLKGNDRKLLEQAWNNTKNKAQLETMFKK